MTGQNSPCEQENFFVGSLIMKHHLILYLKIHQWDEYKNGKILNYPIKCQSNLNLTQKKKVSSFKNNSWKCSI
jgi:hypothetical protein